MVFSVITQVVVKFYDFFRSYFRRKEVIIYLCQVYQQACFIQII